MRTEKVETWLDAGTLPAILETNQYLLENGRENTNSLPELDRCDIHPPVFIHPTARVNQSSIGPHVSIGAGAVVSGSSLKNAVLAPNCQVNASTLADSILGQNVTVSEFSGKLFLGDDSVVNQ
jgi:glucose-1-phosphate thymidylyltransferase